MGLLFYAQASAAVIVLLGSLLAGIAAVFMPAQLRDKLPRSEVGSVILNEIAW
jgi:hypothetical protein